MGWSVKKWEKECDDFLELKTMVANLCSLEREEASGPAWVRGNYPHWIPGLRVLFRGTRRFPQQSRCRTRRRDQRRWTWSWRRDPSIEWCRPGWTRQKHEMDERSWGHVHLALMVFAMAYNSKDSSNTGLRVLFWTLVCCSRQLKTLCGRSSMTTKGSLSPDQSGKWSFTSKVEWMVELYRYCPRGSRLSPWEPLQIDSYGWNRPGHWGFRNLEHLQFVLAPTSPCGTCRSGTR